MFGVMSLFYSIIFIFVALSCICCRVQSQVCDSIYYVTIGMDAHTIKAVNNKQFISFFDPQKKKSRKITDTILISELSARLKEIKKTSPFTPKTKKGGTLTDVRCVLYFFTKENVDTLGLAYSDYMQLNSVYYLVDTLIDKSMQKIIANDGYEFRDYMRFRSSLMSLYEWRTEDSLVRLSYRNPYLVFHTQRYLQGALKVMKKYDKRYEGCEDIDIVLDIMGMPDYYEVHDKSSAFVKSIGYKYGCYRKSKCLGIIWLRQNRNKEIVMAEDIESEK